MSEPDSTPSDRLLRALFHVRAAKEFIRYHFPLMWYDLQAVEEKIRERIDIKRSGAPNDTIPTQDTK